MAANLAGMSDENMTLRFADGGQKVCQVVRGDTRTLQVTVRHKGSLIPVDLTDADVAVCFPRDGGGSIKRRNYPFTFYPTLVAQSPGATLAATSHGFVSSDLCTVAPAPGATLPTGLAAQTLYILTVIDNDTLGFMSLAGAPIAISDAGSGAMSILLQLPAAVPKPASGAIEVPVTTALTQALNAGQGQKLQVSVSSANTIRVVIAPHALDVTDCPYP